MYYWWKRDTVSVRLISNCIFSGKNNCPLLFVPCRLQMSTQFPSVVLVPVYTLQRADSVTCVVLAFVEITYLALRKRKINF